MRTMLPISLALVAAIAMAGCSHPAESVSHASQANTSAAAAIRVAPIKPARKTLVRKIEQPGEVHAFEYTPLYAMTSGYVQKVHVDIGDRVEKGELLLEISIPEYEQELKQKQALVAQAEAETRQAQAAIKVAKAALTSAQALSAEAKAGIERREAEYERAKSESERIHELFENKSVTKKSLDEAQAALRAADASRTEAKAKVASAEAAVEEKEAAVEQAAADADAIASKEQVARADQERLEAVHEYTRITAPYESVVTERNADTGYLVRPSGEKPLLVVVQADTVRVLLDVPEADAALVVTGCGALIRVPATGFKVEKEVSRSSWTLNRATRTLRAEVDVPNAEGLLRPGMYVVAELKVAERHDALALPASAIATMDQQASCLVVNAENKIVRVPISTGIKAGDEVEILSGLNGDDRVIPGNLAAYKEGQLVEVISTPK